MEGLEKLHQQLEKSTIDSLSLVVLSHILAPSPPYTHTHTHTPGMHVPRSILSPSQGMTVCFITIVIIPFLTQSSQAGPIKAQLCCWRKEAALFVLGCSSAVILVRFS